MSTPRLQAGVGRSDISPPVGVAHAGWGAQTHQRSEGNDMPSYATALVVSNGDLALAIVDIDILILNPDMDRAVREEIAERTGIPAEHQRVAYSHTHSGVAFLSRWITEGADLAQEWLDNLPAAAAAAVEQAAAASRPVRVSAGRGECSININRRPADASGRLFTGRNWDGPVDHEVGVVGIDNLDGDPVATLMVYACHPTIMGHENRMVTPDFPGPARRVVEQTVGGTCLFLQGAGGNQGPVHGFTGDLRVYRREGAKLGAAAAAVRLGLDPVQRRERLVEILPSGADLGIYEDEPVGESDDSLAVADVPIDLPLRELRPFDTLQSTYDYAAAELERLRSSGADQAALRLAVSKAQKAVIALNCARLAQRYARDGVIPMTVQAMRIGPAVLVAVPLEPFAEVGLDVKGRSRAPFTFFSGFSNGHFNYLPTDQAIEEGGYEVDVSPFAAGSAGIVTNASLDAIDRVWP